MKIVCINNKGYACKLSIDKIYIAISENHTCYIISDMGLEIPYLKERFKRLDEIRDEKINTILCYIPENK